MAVKEFRCPHCGGNAQSYGWERLFCGGMELIAKCPHCGRSGYFINGHLCSNRIHTLPVVLGDKPLIKHAILIEIERRE
jgi:hypothetical protein